MEDHRYRLLDYKQLARLLGVTVRTIYTWRKQRKIPPPLIKDQNRPFWSIAQIEKWQQGETVGRDTKK
jgi:predicted DNA-binding transcriptional regulator AlpA